jgi:Tfp pilus assembly protein FimT
VSKRTVTNSARSDGYSLTELVIVLACATVLAAAAVPNIVKLREEWTLLGSTRILEASLQWGRMQAVATNTPLSFEIDLDQRKFHWADAVSGESFANSMRQLPEGIRIVAAPRRSLRFYPHGNAAPAGTYTLAGNAGSYSVVVAPGGRIRTQRNE